jgi:hypothetical protein
MPEALTTWPAMPPVNGLGWEVCAKAPMDKQAAAKAITAPADLPIIPNAPFAAELLAPLLPKVP